MCEFGLKPKANTARRGRENFPSGKLLVTKAVHYTFCLEDGQGGGRGTGVPREGGTGTVGFREHRRCLLHQHNKNNPQKLGDCFYVGNGQGGGRGTGVPREGGTGTVGFREHRRCLLHQPTIKNSQRIGSFLLWGWI